MLEVHSCEATGGRDECSGDLTAAADRVKPTEIEKGPDFVGLTGAEPVGDRDGVLVRVTEGIIVFVRVRVFGFVAVGTCEAVVVIVKGQVAGVVAPLSWTVMAPVTLIWPLPLVVCCSSISQFDSLTEPFGPNPIAVPLSMLLFRKTQCMNVWEPST
jgi:hypothetical protein